MVGVHEVGFGVDVGDAVRPEGVHGCELAEESAIGRVGTVVDGQPHPPSGDGSVVGHPGLDVVDDALAATVGGDELLPPAEHQAHRPFGGTGEGGDMGLEVEAALAAEASTEVGHDDAHPVGLHAEGLANTGAGVERHLGARPDGDLVALPLGDDRSWLDGRRVATVGHVAAAHNDVGRGHAGVDVALGDDGESGVVEAAHHLVARPVVGPSLVYQGGLGRQGGLDVVDHRQRLVLDLDRVDGALGCGRVDGCYGGDDLAFEAHYVAGEQGAVLHEGAVAHVGYVVGCDHREHPWHGPRRRHIEVGDEGMGDTHIPELGGEHAGEGEVGGVAPAAGDLVGSVGADEAWWDSGSHLLLDPPAAMMADGGLSLRREC